MSFSLVGTHRRLRSPVGSLQSAFLLFTAGAQAGWVALAFSGLASLPVLIALLVVLTVVELAGPVVATWDSRVNRNEWRGTPWHAHHIAERYGLLVIITLGEGILGTIAAVSAIVEHDDWTGEAVLLVIAGVGITFGLWWSYFVPRLLHDLLGAVPRGRRVPPDAGGRDDGVPGVRRRTGDRGGAARLVTACVTLAPYVVVVGYETVGHRHVAADVDREAAG